MRALGDALKKHWGAVGRDLAVAGYTWDDVGDRLPVDQFMAFIFHAPPGTAVFYERYEHWTVTDHLLTDLLEMQDVLLCTKTSDPKKAMRKLKPRWRPGQKTAKQKAADTKVMTVADYVKRTGMKINIGEGVN